MEPKKPQISKPAVEAHEHDFGRKFRPDGTLFSQGACTVKGCNAMPWMSETGKSYGPKTKGDK